MSPPYQQPSEKLYVTRLPLYADEDWLMQTFSQYGKVVDCKVLTPPKDGVSAASSRHAIVRFISVEEADMVRITLNGFVLPGCETPIQVDFAKPSTKGPAGWDGGSGLGSSGGKGYGIPVHAADTGLDWSKGTGKGKQASSMEAVIKGFAALGVLPGSNAPNDDNALCLIGLPSDCDDIHLYKLCSSFGPIAPNGAAAVKGRDGWCKGLGFVHFVNVASSEAAVAVLHGCKMPDGSVLQAAVKGKLMAQQQARYQQQRLCAGGVAGGVTGGIKTGVFGPPGGADDPVR